jgi:hypothetical protein
MEPLSVRLEVGLKIKESFSIAELEHILDGN